MSRPNEPLTEYVLTATVDGEEVYRSTQATLESIVMSMVACQEAVNNAEENL